MPKRSTLYLLILAGAVLAWFPLYPLLFALTSDQRPLLVGFLKDTPRYVYFADSVITTSTPCESDHRNIVQMLPPAIAGRTMLFAGGGGNAHLWRDAALFIAAHGQGTVQAAALPINMGVFSPRWEHDPDYAFEQDGMLYNLASGRTTWSDYLSYLQALHSFGRVGRRQQAVQQLGRLPVMAGGKRLGTLEEIATAANMPQFPCRVDLNRYARPLGLNFAIHYGEAIGGGDAYFTDLDQTIARLRQAKIRTVVYLTPVDLDDVARFGGPDVLAQLKANIALVRAVGRQRGWNVIDLSGALSGDHFITRECACEHVDAFGRALIAGKLAPALAADAP